MAQVRSEKLEILQVFPWGNPHNCSKAPAPVAVSAPARDWSWGPAGFLTDGH